MATTAEGVETQEQLDALASAGCTEVQGYLFSPAVPAARCRLCCARSPRCCGPRSDTKLPALGRTRG